VEARSTELQKLTAKSAQAPTDGHAGPRPHADGLEPPDPTAAPAARWPRHHVTVAAVAGAGESGADTNLRTHTDFDNLGRTTATTNPTGVVTTYAYDRLGRLLSATVDPGSSPHLAITALAAYDAAGDLLATCSPNAVAAGCSSANITTNSRAWRYTYDLDSNRTSVTESGTTTYYAYDRSDELIWKGPNQDGSGSSGFEFDSLGQMTTSQPARPGSGVLHPTDYAYDPAGHLTGISADGTTTSFAIDALGRHANQTVGSDPVTTYAYLGTSDTVSSSSQSGVVSYSAIDAIGDRLTTGTASAFGWLLVDLHGNVTGVITSGSSPSYSSAYRYDAYGETCDLYTSGSGAIKSPWRFQGRILESADGSTDLYDFQARSYDPSLGAFTSFDSVSGSAQNPLTLNRFLYAAANPATLVDPDGHRAKTYAENGEGCTYQSCRASDAVLNDDDYEKAWMHRRPTESDRQRMLDHILATCQVDDDTMVDYHPKWEALGLLAGNDHVKWPHRDHQIWPHPRPVF
jgi:RHS repeat-associated protein